MEDTRVCQGYRVIRSRRVGDTELVLAHNPDNRTAYVTWKAYAHTGFQSFNYGCYFEDREAAERSFDQRFRELCREYAGLHAPQRRGDRDR